MSAENEYNSTAMAFGSYEGYRDEMMYEDDPYQAAVQNAAQGVSIGDEILAEWSARLARELLARGLHKETEHGS